MTGTLPSRTHPSTRSATWLAMSGLSYDAADVHAPVRHARARRGAGGDRRPLRRRDRDVRVGRAARRAGGRGVRAPRVARRLPPVAAAARVRDRGATSTMPITVAALLVPLHDPVRLAEDMAVLDVISRGRRRAHRGPGLPARGVRDVRPSRSPSAAGAWRSASPSSSGRGRARSSSTTVARCGCTPRPITPGGPLLMYGGGSRAAARRAARFGLGFFAQTWAAGLEEAYLDECARLGNRARDVHAPGAAAARRRCSSPKTSTGRGTASGRSCSTTRACTRRGSATRRP